MALAYHAKRRAGGPQAPLRIGVIGMGAGMIATLGREGDILRYYELNPAVHTLTSRHFTFIKDSKAKVDVLLGDARLVLERQLAAGDNQSFDVLVLDAFRGASPPMHLMTKEAFNIYFGHLAENGILAVNFELDTFEVAPLHRGMAKEFGINVGWFETRQDDEACAGSDQLGGLHPRSGFLRRADRAQGRLALARQGQVRADLDRPGQQSDEHRQLGPQLSAQRPTGLHGFAASLGRPECRPS